MHVAQSWLSQVAIGQAGRMLAPNSVSMERLEDRVVNMVTSDVFRPKQGCSLASNDTATPDSCQLSGFEHR